MLLLAGIFFGQVLLYGPSLVGLKILLPLDILTQKAHLIPPPSDQKLSPPANFVLSDLLYCGEPGRHFLRSEFRAGRIPLWDPNQYAGAPAVAPKLSPFNLLFVAIESPVVIAWAQLLVALLAGTGMYVFLRRAVGLRYWPSLFAAWCYPLTGYFALWQGYTVSLPVIWLPWLLLAIRSTSLRPLGFGGIGVAAATMLVITAGQFDVAALVLLTSGLYALWCWRSINAERWLTRPALMGLLAVTLGWGLGMCLAASDLIPAVTYAQTGARMAHRVAGVEERPPIGLAALPRVVFPMMYGSTEYGSYPLFPPNEPNLLESSAGAYAGLLATLFLVPLAFCSYEFALLNASNLQCHRRRPC